MLKCASVISLAFGIVSTTAFGVETTTAAKVNSNETKVAAPVEAKKAGYIQEGSFLKAYYSESQSIDFKVAGAAGSLNSSAGAFGVGVQYSRIPANEFGFTAGVNFELPRELTSETIQSVRVSDKSKSKWSYLYIDPSLTYGLNDKTFVYGGLNYNQFVGSIADSTISGSFGYQFGAGYQFTNKWSLDAAYRVLGFKATSNTVAGGQPREVEFNEAQMKGFLVNFKYSVQ